MIVCICAPPECKEEVEKLNHKETLAGNIVVTAFLDPTRMAGTVSKSRLRRLAIQGKKLSWEKIELADKVIIIKPQSFWYTGFEALNYAMEKGKSVEVI